MDEDTEILQAELEEVKEAYEDFKEKLGNLMRGFSRHPDSAVKFCATRFGAYNPGFDPGYDAGMGMNLSEFFDEWSEALDNIGEENEDED